MVSLLPSMMQAWFNMAVNVQRRNPSAPKNPLNEPGYGNDASLPVVYANMPCRIEYADQKMEFGATGERVTNPSILMFCDKDYTIKPEDRVVITQSDNQALIGQLYIVLAVYSEWDGMGNVHHFIVELEIH